MHLVMFDIDGTLVDSNGFDGALYAQAVRAVLQVDVDTTWGSYLNITDSGILDELLERHALMHRAAELRPRVQSAFVALVEAHVAADAAAIREISGAKRLVEMLLEMPDVRVAIATGGWRASAELKLWRVGIDPTALAFATASEALARTSIMELAERRALRGSAAHRRTYFGDGPWDKRASAALGYDFVAVGSAVEHEVRFADLADHATILGHLGVDARALR